VTEQLKMPVSIHFFGVGQLLPVVAGKTMISTLLSCHRRYVMLRQNHAVYEGFGDNLFQKEVPK